MTQNLGYVTLVVRDYDEALAFFTQALFELIEDVALGRGKRWVLVAPPRGVPVRCSLKRRTRNKPAAVTKPVDAYFFSCTPMISGLTTAP